MPWVDLQSDVVALPCQTFLRMAHICFYACVHARIKNFLSRGGGGGGGLSINVLQRCLKRNHTLF